MTAGVYDYMTGTQKYGLNYRGPIAGFMLLLVTMIASGQGDLPDKPDLIRVTVDHADNGVLIEWEPSTSDSIRFYHLYKMIARTGQKIASFSGETYEYKHMSSGLDNLAYTITAEDSAGNESLLADNQHRAVSVSIAFDPCETSNTISWTGYEGWEGSISGYKVYGGIAGSTLQMLRFVNANTRSYPDNGVLVDSHYSYYVEAVHTFYLEADDTTKMVSRSPLDSINTLYPDPPEHLTVDWVSVVDRFEIDLQFTADVGGPVNSFRVMKRSNPGSLFTEVETIWNTQQSTHIVEDRFPTVHTSYEYIVLAVYQPESCPAPLVVDTSNSGTSILLESTLASQIATLNWTHYKDYDNGRAGYIIQRKSGDGEFFDVETVGPETNSWSESIQSVINGFQPGQLQYKVLAISNDHGADGPAVSISNIVEVAVETHLLMPSAFTPGSNDMNFEFKPVIDFAPRDYALIVFDRGGRKLFETSDPGEGWNGSYGGGDYVMEGVYVYFIQYTDYTGLTSSFSGNVTVIYP